ncbi:MAG: hydroxyphenylacetyl-CoA thioesterase PaaI [Beijerinckiaceae bacterium]|jgi:acyl-CoA thioesterase|nr:hydroxyphenylacetyl-CoA thioesterase PaaI [Beijerinckiaceae bacterium]
MTTMTRDELAKACAEAMWAEDNASAGQGMVLVSVGPGRSEIAMEVADHMVNGHGSCHGGFIFALADSAFAFACNTHNQRVVAQHCSITYLAPGRKGDRLVARGEETSRQGRSGIYDITVTNQDGVTIALFRGHSRTVKGEFFPGVTIEG